MKRTADKSQGLTPRQLRLQALKEDRLRRVFALASGATAQSLDRTTTTLHAILERVIAQCAADNTDPVAGAEASARAFRAGLAAFAAPTELLTGSSNDALSVTKHYGNIGQAQASVASSPISAGKIADARKFTGIPDGLRLHIDKAAEVEMKTYERLRQLCP